MVTRLGSVTISFSPDTPPGPATATAAPKPEIKTTRSRLSNEFSTIELLEVEGHKGVFIVTCNKF